MKHVIVPVLLLATLPALAAEQIQVRFLRHGAARTQGQTSSREPFAIDDGEFLVDTAGIHAELFPAVAFDGTNFLVVWQDHRRGGGTPDIYGARVSPDGAVLDPAGIAISTAEYGQGYPDLAFDGTNFLVVWMDARNQPQFDIYGARVTPQGTVLDTGGIPIATTPTDEDSPALAFDDTSFLVVWDQESPSHYSDIYGARVSPQGFVLDTAAIPISTAVDWQREPDVASGGGNFLVVWHDSRSGPYDIYGTRVTTEGLVLDSAGIRISSGAYNEWSPALAYGGADFLVTWQDSRTGGHEWDICGARVSPQGLVRDTNCIPIAQAAFAQESSSVAFDGTSFLVVWQDTRSGVSSNVHGARVTPEGVVFDSGPVVRQEGDQRCPVLARGPGARVFLVYQGWTGTVGDKTYNTDRIWGKMDPVPGVTETMNDERGPMNAGPTIVRSVLFLPEATSHKLQAASLVDATGRKVMELRTGANDVRSLALGVYFVREASGVEREASRVTKVVVTR